MSESNHINNKQRSETQSPEILNIEDIINFDKYKRDDRDSVDTLELIRDSADLTKRSNASQKQVALIEEKRPVVTAKEVSSVSSSNFNDNDEFKDEPLGLEITNEPNDVIFTSNNQDPSRQSISSTQSSLNLGPNVYPLSIVDKSEDSKDSDDSKYRIDKNVPDDEIETADLAHLEPKLREAWIKMRKLDKILERAYTKEKMVKKETLKLIEKNRADLELLRLTSDHKESKQEAENTAHFLALSYFGDLDDEIFKEDFKDTNPINDEPPTPVFKTQVPMDDLMSNYDETSSLNNTQTQSNVTSKSFPTKKTESFTNETNTSQKRNESKFNTTKLNKNSKKNSSEKDFIKRNIQLVQDAGGALAMTDEEKARLNELLLEDNEDKNKQNFIKEGGEENPTYLVEYNPYSVALAEGDGFTPDRNEMQRLKEIESKLDKRNNSRLVSDSLTTINDQYKGNSSFSVSGKSSKHSLNNAYNIDSDSYFGLFNSESKQIRLNDEFDENEFGDKFIREARITREQENRLKFIDSQLQKFKITSQSNGDLETIRSESSSSLISQQQLKVLLQECTSEMSESQLNNYNKLDVLKEEDDLIEENGSIYSSEQTNERLSMVPALNDNVIQNLLEQAKLEGIFVETDNNEPQVQSYYEEALEIVSSYRKLAEQNDVNFQLEAPPEPIIENEEYKMLNKVTGQYLKNYSDSDNDSDSQTYTPSSPSQLNKYSNESEEMSSNNANKLPPLYNNKNDLSENNTIQNEARSSSSMSNLSSISTSSLPKISSRYLPK